MPIDESKAEVLMPRHTLGTVQLRQVETNQLLLIPQPSNDPNDPLNWSTAQRWYVLFVSCLAIFTCNFLNGGPSVALVEMAVTFYGPPGPNFPYAISQAAFFFTAPAVMLGVANLIWIPLAIKYGRRPVYLVSFTLLLASSIWSALSKTYASMLGARIMVGTAAAAAEILSPLTITDIFFLHQRGLVLGLYQMSLASGVTLGTTLSGLMTIRYGWRDIIWLDTALVSFCLVLMFFTFPESVYDRAAVFAQQSSAISKPGHSTSDEAKLADKADVEEMQYQSQHSVPKKQTYLQSLQLFTGVHTGESLLLLILRPLVLFPLPPVLWASFVSAAGIGMLIVVSTNYAIAFQTTYGFEAWQSGLVWIAGFIGGVVAIFGGGTLCDSIADRLTTRNHGLREPEMRLPAMTASLITGPLGSILYGVGIGQELHWMCPAIGIALISFTVVQCSNVATVYILDAYRPIAGEVIVTQSVFKSGITFLLAFYANNWINKSGHIRVFGIDAGIICAVYIIWIPLYIWGKQIRHRTWHWSILRRFVYWADDREVGE